MVFHPNSPRYQRGIILSSIYMTAIAGFGVSMGDFGKQEHILTPWQKFLTRQIDSYFGITEAQIEERIQQRKLLDRNRNYPQQ